jgi:hypothetical protein
MRKRAAFLSVVFAVALCLAAFTASNDGSSGPDILVVVNGLAFARTLPGELAETFGVDLAFDGEREDYLQPALAPLLGSEYDIRTFGWSGDATETGDILAAEGSGSLRSFLRAAHAEARAKGVKFVVAAHSWGTFLSYMALAMESAGADPIECDLFITLSCPIAANHAGSTVDPLDAAVEAYANAWLDDLGFAIGGELYPRAERFLDYWAWGDCISGPLATRIPAAAGVRDIQVDFFGVADATSLKRGIDDVLFWHDFTSLRASVASATDYAASEGFGEDVPSLVSSFRGEVAGEILRAGSSPASQADQRLRITLSSLQCTREPEWGNSEFYGFFRIKRDGSTFSARKWYEDGDALSAWLKEGESRSVGWTRDIPVTRGVPATVSLETAFYEDDIGGDGPPGTGSVSFSFDGRSWTLPADSGSVDCAWTDGDGEGDTMRVFWTASLVGDD